MAPPSPTRRLIIAAIHEGDLLSICAPPLGAEPSWHLPSCTVKPDETLDAAAKAALAAIGLTTNHPVVQLGPEPNVDTDGRVQPAQLVLVLLADRGSVRVAGGGVLWRSVLGGPPHHDQIDTILADVARARADIHDPAILKLSTQMFADAIAITTGPAGRDQQWWEQFIATAAARQQLAEQFSDIINARTSNRLKYETDPDGAAETHPKDST